MDEEESKVALKLTTREVDGVTVVALDGRIVLGEESNALREKVKSLVAEGKKKIVLNMDNVTGVWRHRSRGRLRFPPNWGCAITKRP